MERRGLACEPGEVAPMHKVVLALFLLWDGEDNTDAGSLKNLQSRRSRGESAPRSVPQSAIRFAGAKKKMLLSDALST